MNIRRPVRARALSAAAQANVARIEAMWSECRARHGGPFLFGKFCAADAMYAPVVTRLHTYGIKVSRETLGYMEADDGIAGVCRMARRRARRALDRRRGRDRLADRAVNARWTERQLPQHGEVFIDHVGYFVADLDAAGAQLERLGFRVSLVNVQTNADASGALKPSGTSNRLAKLSSAFWRSSPRPTTRRSPSSSDSRSRAIPACT